MNTKTIAAEMAETLKSLTQLISSFNQEQINIVPFEDSWTAGQLAKHLIMSGSGFINVINGAVKDTERKPDEMAASIKKDLLDISTKLKSPDFIVPPDTSYNKENLVHSIENIKIKAARAIETLDLTKTCIAFQLPNLGFLTRLEAIYFIIYHTQRHNHQLKNIFKKVVEKENRLPVDKV